MESVRFADPVVIAGHSRLSARRCRRARCRAHRRETATPWYPDGRYYDPSTAQFISVDPAVSQTGQPYAYADDDPANLSDPTGLSWYNPATWNWKDIGIGLGVTAAAAGTVACAIAEPCGIVEGLAALGIGGEEVGGLALAATTTATIAEEDPGMIDSAGADLSDAAVMGSESFLEGGATVRFSETATAIGDDEDTLQNFARSTGAAGQDVIVHGALADGEAQFVVNGIPTSAQQIADAVLANPNYSGGSICLVTCYGAQGLSQQLEDILGVDVTADAGRVDLDPQTGFLRRLP